MMTKITTTIAGIYMRASDVSLSKKNATRATAPGSAQYGSARSGPRLKSLAAERVVKVDLA